MSDMVERLQAEIEVLRAKLAFEAASIRFRQIAGSQPVLETFLMKAAEIERLAQDNARLLAALDRLLHVTMYKEHPEASQMAIDALAGRKLAAPGLGFRITNAEDGG